jgi:hypothetical protein
MPPKGFENRFLTIYFPTAEEVNDIKDAAEKAGLHHAHFMREMIRKGMEAQKLPDIDAIHNTTELKGEVAVLRRELKDKAAYIEKLETEIFNLKHSLFLQPIPTGVGRSVELVELLQDRRVWRTDDIMLALNIDSKNIDALKALAGQLHALQDLKLLTETSKGWRWVGDD